MKKNLIKIALLLFPSLVMAQFSVSSDLSLDYGKDANIKGIDTVVVFEKIDATAQLTYVFANSTQSEWHYHTATSDSLIASSVLNDTITVIDSLQQGTYELRLNSTTSYFYAVVDFSEYQPVVDSVWVDDSGDSCNYVSLYASLDRPEIPVYDKLNDSIHLLETPKTTYIWSNAGEDSQSPIRQDAPFEDIEYACVPYSDDFFSSNDLVVDYFEPDTVYAAPYTAIAVKMGTLEASIPDEEENSNVTFSSTTTEGSAPLNVTYSVTSEGAAEYTSWWVWNIDVGSPSSPTYRYQDQVTHSFLKYATNGYRVKVVVGNDYCQVSDSMDVKVTQSSLEVPNILVLGFGATGQFKVAYQSIDPSSFKAAIYDRKGRLVHKWDDPKGGWDGRSPVTNAYVSPGAYYYSIQARGTDGEKYELIGDVNVIREKGM